MSWLVDTLVWTAAFIAMVLLVRRPVARHFGPQAAYALWLLPFLRLLLPPITLPAWLAPAREQVPVAAEESVYYVVEAADVAARSVSVEAASAIDYWAIAGAIWLTGAGIFLVRRFAAYFAMRRTLLENARPVGNSGNVRLVETSATNAPIAFGVVDKVVALPVGFMAQHDRAGRDLAIAHELCHHRGHDLLANFALQPLFALHWFNPLSRLGWLAVRRDQEAACDARVVRGCNREARAAYGRVIASFAAGPVASLAAPMACPVLGDKSIIHRLRSLANTERSARRRLAGRAAIVGAVLALPLTASITYAEAVAPTPTGLEAPAAPIAPVLPVSLQSVDPSVTLPPDAPKVPESPEAPASPRHVIVKRLSVADGKSEHETVIVRRIGNGEAPEIHAFGPGRVIVRDKDWSGMSDEDRAELEREMAELRKEFGPGGKFQRDMDEMRRQLDQDISGEVARALSAAPRVVMDCRGEDGQVSTGRDGRQIVRICQSRHSAAALEGLREARRDIARDRDMSDESRAHVLESLDRSIEKLEAKNK